MLNKEEGTVIIGLFDGRSLCADPLWLALCFYVRFCCVLGLFVAFGELTCELFELDVALAWSIEVVSQVLHLPVLKESQTLDFLFELLTRDVAIFVAIELFEEYPHFWVVLLRLDSLKTV